MNKIMYVYVYILEWNVQFNVHSTLYIIHYEHLIYNVTFWGLAAMCVEGVPMSWQTLQLPSAGWQLNHESWSYTLVFY